jgi:protocatechuate 3,4-dioxygenase beta subunit
LVVGLRDTPRVPVRTLVPSPLFPVEGRAKVCVDVVDASGKPILHAELRAYAERSGRRFEAVEQSATGRCLEAVPLGAVRVLGEAPGFARASVDARVQGDTTLKLTLLPARKLAVTVLDELSAALASATVLVTASDPLPFGKLTDASGRAGFERLPGGPYTVRVLAPGYESASRNDVSEDVTLTLRRLAAIDVRVLDGAGKGVAEAAVLIAGPSLWPARRAVTDAAGLAKIRGLAAGSYDLTATHGTYLAPPRVGFELTRGAHENVTLQLEPGRLVTALVTDGEGADAPPVAQADVVLVEGGVGSFPLRGRSGADGKAVLGPIGGGPATLAARAPDFVGGPLVNVPPSGDEPVRVPLIRGATVRGEVVDARGYPVGGAQVEMVGTDRFGLPIAETPLMSSFRALHFAWSLAGPRALIPSGELGVMPGPVPPIPRAGAVALAAPLEELPAGLESGSGSAWISDRGGAFVARPVTPGRVRALVRHPEYVEGTSELVALAPAGEARVRVVLLRGGRLEGRVVDERGFPVSGAAVKLVGLSGTFERGTFTVSDGAFAFAAVPRAVTLSAERADDPGRVAVRRTLDVPEGERVDIELALPPHREPVKILVTDDRNAPVPLAEVRVASLDPTLPLRTTLFTDDAGAAELREAEGLALRISVDAPRFARVERDVERAPREIRVAIDPGVLVTGSVTAVRGRRAVANALITMRSAGQRKSTMTDADGTFRIAGIAAGSVEISVTHPEFAETRTVREVTRPARTERPFELPAIDLAEPCEARGRVVDASDRPVEGARVAVGVVPAYLPQGALPAGVAVTDAAGEFVLRGLAPGTVRLQAYAAGLGRGELDGVALSSGQTTQIAAIRLTQRDSEIEPVASGGVAITLGERADGVVVVQVVAGSEAERGGLAPGDAITRIDDERPANMSEARARLAGPAGSDVIVIVKRDGAERRLRVTREPVRR